MRGFTQPPQLRGFSYDSGPCPPAQCQAAHIGQTAYVNQLQTARRPPPRHSPAPVHRLCVAETQRGRVISHPASAVNRIVGSSEPVTLSSPCEALLEPRVRYFSRRESDPRTLTHTMLSVTRGVFAISLTDVRMTILKGRGSDRCPSVALLEPRRCLDLLTRGPKSFVKKTRAPAG